MTRKERAQLAARARWDRAKATKAAKTAAPRRGVSDAAIVESARAPARSTRNPFGPAEFPQRAQPRKALAMDSTDSLLDAGAWAFGILNGIAVEGQTFLGYPYLAELSQRPEYRRMVEQMAFHMTRRWIRLKYKGGSQVPEKRDGVDDDGPLPGEKPAAKPAKPAQDEFPPKGKGNGKAPGAGLQAAEPKLSAAGTPLLEPEHTQADQEEDERAERLDELEQELKRLRVKQHFKEIVEQDGFFGRGHIYIDLGTTDDQGSELATSIGNGRDDAAKLKIAKGSLKGLKPVEPIWAYPMTYEAIDPLRPGWYRPDHWYVMRRQVHRTRLLTFVSREVPDLLKPAYAFGGLPLTQIAKPYVDNWLRTRQSIADLVKSFSQFVLSTDVIAQTESAQGSANFFKRLDLFNNTRNNRGVMAIDKEREEFANVSAPLSSLDALQAQSQEQMAFVSGIPIMFLLGDQPTGLNASSEGAIRAFYDWVHASQEFLFEKALDSIIAFAQLNIWGEVDEDIEFEFVPLWTPTEKEEAEMRKADADRDAVYLTEGVVHPDEVRQKLVDDPDSGYKLEATREMPEPPPPEMPPGFGAPPGGKPGKPGAQGDTGKPPPPAKQ